MCKSHEEECEVHLCPVCLDNADDDTPEGLRTGMCTICGQMYCGTCTKQMAGRVSCCPTCRSPPSRNDKERVARLKALVYDRTPGRHTPRTQFSLGDMYLKGKGVEQNYLTAAKYFRVAAKGNVLGAQYNLAIMYTRGDGVKRDEAMATKWFKLAASKGHRNAIRVLSGSSMAESTGVAMASTR